MADDLAAEIAEHTAYDFGMTADGQCSEHIGCRDCGETWPCLVRRLASAHADLLMAGNALAERVGPALVHGHVGALLDARDAWRALAPADGEKSPHE